MKQQEKDRRVAAAEKKIVNAEAKMERARNAAERAEAELRQAKADLDWLQQMPVGIDARTEPTLPFEAGGK